MEILVIEEERMNSSGKSFLYISFHLYMLLKSLYSDTNILSKYIPSLQKKL
jgi:hypothetical protein